MRRNSFFGPTLILAVLAGAGTELAAAGKGRSDIVRLQPGLWQVTELDRPINRSRSICLADPQLLAQLEHGNATCSRMVLARQGKSLTIHYTCVSGGFGRTVVRIQSPDHARLDTQGILSEAPFAYRAEARRLGSCGKATARR